MQETTLRVKERHSAIADKSFNMVRRIPLVSGPAQLVQTAHDAISAAVHAAIRHSGGGLFAATAMVEKQHTGELTEQTSRTPRQRSAQRP